MVQWLGLLTFTSKVQSLIVELRSHKLHSVEKKKTSVVPKNSVLLPISSQWISAQCLITSRLHLTASS